MIKFIEINDTKLAYGVYGDGPTVVLLHGFGEDSAIWDHQVQFLQKNYRLIVPDLPGSGESEMIVGEHVTIKDYAKAMLDLIAIETSEKFHLIGHSMGGYTALAMAAIQPEKLQTLTLFHSSAYADDEAKIETRKKAIAFIKANGGQSFLKTAIPGLFKDTDISQADIDKLLERGSAFTDEALVQYYEAMISRPDTTHVLRELEVPALFILGEYDKAVPFDKGLEQAHMPQTGNLTILRNSAHMGMLEETELSNKTLSNFLSLN